MDDRKCKNISPRIRMDKAKDLSKMSESLLANTTDIEMVGDSIVQTTQKIRLTNAKLMNSLKSLDGGCFEMTTGLQSKICELQHELTTMSNTMNEMKKKNGETNDAESKQSIHRDNPGRKNDSGYYSETISQGASSQDVGNLIEKETKCDSQDHKEGGGPITEESGYEPDTTDDQTGKTDQEQPDTTNDSNITLADDTCDVNNDSRC